MRDESSRFSEATDHLYATSREGEEHRQQCSDRKSKRHKTRQRMQRRMAR